jgi:hypothetical protein
MGIQFLVPFLVPLALQAGTSYMCPHISGTECVGFSKQDAFHLLLKVSCANICWANSNDTFLTHKNPQTETFLRDMSVEGVQPHCPHPCSNAIVGRAAFRWSSWQ